MRCISPSYRARVMVVEDDAVTRRLFCNAIELESTLLLAGSCSTVADALVWLELNQCDLLLTDLGFPDGSGLIVIDACRRLNPQADIMVITMSSDEDQVLACIEAGASGYVLKETGHKEVVRALLEVLNGGSPISPVIARKVLMRMRLQSNLLADSVRSTWNSLTRREAAILQLIARGSSYAKVASALGLSIGTVQTHIKHIYGKLSVHSRGEAVYEARRRGLLSVDGFVQTSDRPVEAD